MDEEAATGEDQTASSGSFDDRMTNVLNTIEKDEDNNPDKTAASAAAAGESAVTEPPKKAIGEGKDKTSEAEKPEQTTTSAIEPPISWPSDDKEAFKSLPTWAQERIVARENEREAFLSERSRTLAAKERDISNVQRQASEAQAYYASELQRLNELANQLMPAKFSEIKSQADYLRMKKENPALASEYDAFVGVLQGARQQQAQLQHQRLIEHLDREFAVLSDKFPEFKDSKKAAEIMADVRKSAVDFYGFSPEEVKVIVDHRYIPVLRDAMAWRQYQANVKAAAAKKVVPQPTNIVRQASTTGAALSSDQKVGLLKKARGAQTLDEKAAHIAALIEQGA